MLASVIKRTLTSSHFRKRLLHRPRERVVVVIPVYRDRMTHAEDVSFRRCVAVLGHYPIALAAPEGLPVEAYTSLCPGLRVKRFPAPFFDGIQGYNQLTLSVSFYESFADYAYMLIYQLDCYVFRDELKDWCRRGYDYIGAPWMGAYSQQAFYRQTLDKAVRRETPVKRAARRLLGRRFEDVGNGGLSLRKVKTFIVALTVLAHRVKTWPYYEDLFFSVLVPILDLTFRVPDRRTAMRFSVETSPEECYALLGNTLPFGCHAPEKYGKQFWPKFMHP
ncbi:MAG: hypothetical protein ICV83_25160 [Cytophagales bacterium]|nr:hypothetical protein [Cytophagales bacterium]